MESQRLYASGDVAIKRDLEAFKDELVAEMDDLFEQRAARMARSIEVQGWRIGALCASALVGCTLLALVARG